MSALQLIKFINHWILLNKVLFVSILFNIFFLQFSQRQYVTLGFVLLYFNVKSDADDRVNHKQDSPHNSMNQEV